MAGSTTRAALPYPVLGDAADISQAVQPLATRLDAIMAGFLKGTLAARPAAGATNNGFVYYATDNGIVYFSDGTTWQRIDLDMLNRIITLEAVNSGSRLTALEAKIPTAVSAFRAEQNTLTNLQTIGSTTPASFPTVRHALNALSALVGGSTWTIPTTGLYRYDYNLIFSGNPGISSGVVRTTFQKHAGPVVIHNGQTFADLNGNNTPNIQGSGSYQLTSGDVVELLVNGQGGTLQYSGYLEFALERV